MLDSIYREHRSRVDFSAASTRLDLARVWRYTAGEASHLDDRHWLALSYTRDDVTLDEAPSLRGVRSARAEAAASLTTVHDGRWTSDVWVGASGAGMLGGARLRYTFARERTAALEISINARSTDSLALELLDGRENRAALGVGWLIEADLAFAAQAQFRQLYLAHQRIGEGTSIDFSLDQTLTREGHGPRITVGYRGAYGSFTPEPGADPALVDPVLDPLAFPGTAESVLGNLVSRRLNRHGLGLLVTDNLGDAWVYRLRAGGDYDFELSSFGWNAGLALTFYPRKSIEFTTELGYTSSANASNAGSSATLLNFYLRSYY